MIKHRILIIGSKDHSRAECCSWADKIPNIEEFDFLIINMQSLDREIFEKKTSEIYQMRESIETLLVSGRKVFCIMNNEFRDNSKNFITGYSWLPPKIILDSRKSGPIIELIDPNFGGFMRFVQKWDVEICLPESFNEPTVSLHKYRLTPIAKNKSGKVIAAKLEPYCIITDEFYKGIVYLLPTPSSTRIFEAIESLLDIILGPPTKLPPAWTKSIEVPFDRELADRVICMKEEISKIEYQILDFQSYKELLFETGKKLERIVQKTLNDFGITTKETESGFPSDLINAEISVEITGIKGCLGVGSEKVNQLGRFKENYQKNEKIVLIVNTYCETPAYERKGKLDFSKEVRKYFEALDVAYLTTFSLFQLWKDVKLGKKKPFEVRNKIFKTIGEVTS